MHLTSKRRTAADYGFNERQNCIPQFQDVLGLKCSQDAFNKVMRVLAGLCVENYDIDSVPSNQIEATSKILGQLPEAFPDLFGARVCDAINLKRIYIAQRVAYRLHCQRRKRQKLPGAPLSEKDNQKIAGRHCKANGQYSTKESHGSVSLNSPNCMEISMRPASLISSMNHSQFEDPVTQLRVCRLNVEVENFLSSSQPSLVHLTRRLVEIGCYSEQDLFAMASREKETRYRDLKEILKGATEMDILFFEHHLDNVFDDAKRKEGCQYIYP